MKQLPSRLWFAVTISAWLAASSARAQPSAAAHPRPAKVTLFQSGCSAASFDTLELAKLLRVEFQALGISELEVRGVVAEDEVHSSGVAIIELRCDSPADPGNVSVTLADLATGKRVLRDLVVSDIELDARPRALSLALALLVESSWLEVATTPNTAPRLPDSVRAALRRRLAQHVAEPAQQPEPHNALLLFATARSFPARGTAVLGGELAYLAILGGTRVLLNAEALIGNQEISDAAGLIAHMQLIWLNAGLSVLWASNTLPELLIGPCARIGYGVASASQVRQGVDNRSRGAPTAALGVSALLRAPATSSVDIWVGLDIGYVTSGVVFLTDQNRTAGLADITAALRTGLNLKL